MMLAAVTVALAFLLLWTTEWLTARRSRREHAA